MNNQHRAIIIKKMNKVVGKLSEAEVNMGLHKFNNAMHCLVQANSLLMETVIKFEAYERKDKLSVTL